MKAMPSPTALGLGSMAVVASAATPGGTARRTLQRQSQPLEKMPYLNKRDLEALMGSTNYRPERDDEKWVSLSEDVEFLPLLNDNDKKKAARNLRQRRSLEDAGEEGDAYYTQTGAYADYDPYSVQPFVEGMSEYDEYQQAWRLLGFVVDCNANLMDDDWESSGGSGGSGDEVTEAGCARYVLWAAYVDLDYEGAGIGEYQYYDASTGKWDDSGCYYAEGGSHKSGSGDNRDDDDGKGYKSRCAKMDCHLEDTSFSVLGFFKHKKYDDWMEQLFKHEGMCVWSEEQYAFMKGARKTWPQGCTYTGKTAGDGSSLYYDIRPLRNGKISVGLYTDEECVTNYPADTDKIENIIGNFIGENWDYSRHSGDGDDDSYDFTGESLSASLERWDEAFSVWNTCHPCVAYDIENVEGNKYLDDDDDYADDGGRRKGRGRRRLGGEYAAQGDIFECYDDAGYTNVNQCMKFSAKTVMKTATFRDLSLARHQGSLAENPLSGYYDAGPQYHRDVAGSFGTYFLFAAASVGLLAAAVLLWKVNREAPRKVGGGRGGPLLTCKGCGGGTEDVEDDGNADAGGVVEERHGGIPRSPKRGRGGEKTSSSSGGTSQRRIARSSSRGSRGSRASRKGKGKEKNLLEGGMDVFDSGDDREGVLL